MSIDETPLAYSTHERRDSLEKHLQMRPDVQDLKDRHILLDTKVDPYAACLPVGLDLQKSLEKRPAKDELVERNILLATNQAAALQGPARDLERHMLADNLEHKIMNRPQPEDLITQGILEEDEDPRSA
ncbi:hypothetical protein N7495_007352 [Penicillium taxi]|uniref:uncharacterized protein n=1 Tax=Penicillium taxi TaxID=168475 RepID=UPI0025456135|nr:uncharacterized protein N7495_007352 [Penicillium taxi]KAJ5895661.1 hypothetical protein N7495_007352 [Penicillium taxi]